MVNDLIKKVNQGEFKKEIKEGLSLVDFFAEWCGPCRMQVPILKEFAKEMEGQVKVLKVDIDHTQELASEFHVTSVPTLILFKNGKEVDRAVGLKDLEGLQEFVQSYL